MFLQRYEENGWRLFIESESNAWHIGCTLVGDMPRASDVSIGALTDHLALALYRIPINRNAAVHRAQIASEIIKEISAVQ